jgi:hypothetical protein
MEKGGVGLMGGEGGTQIQTSDYTSKKITWNKQQIFWRNVSSLSDTKVRVHPNFTLTRL